ncbi:hypothetical protein NPIL_307991 [Nephila pilipes]|uniref:Secreted protein n=1 Tax=Nephila pilipes TaxID=299642 RepID=A0A8X6UMU3_NEPPI|nr:hypothetical protein NPIL_307991 [Nephila pilipes]
MNVKYFLLTCLQLHALVLVQCSDVYNFTTDRTLDGMQTPGKRTPRTLPQIGTILGIVQGVLNKANAAEIIKNLILILMKGVPALVRPSNTQAISKNQELKKNGAKPED